MSKKCIRLFILAIIVIGLLSIANISMAVEVTETEKSDIIKFLEDNGVLSYYNYNKVEDICITPELLQKVKKERITEAQLKDTEIYEMVEDYEEARMITKENLNSYLYSTIGISMDKLRNYEEFIKQTTTTNNKDQFFYLVITGPITYNDYEITKIEQTSDETIKVTITAKAAEESFSNVIELAKKDNSYNFVSSTSADGKNRAFYVSDKNEFNNKNEEIKQPVEEVKQPVKETVKEEEPKQDNTVATKELAKAGDNANIAVISVITMIIIVAIIMFVAIIFIVNYKK